MSIFQNLTNTQAYLKCGLMGFAGSGKSTTASNIAIGLVEHMRALKLEMGNRPVMFMDTETGSTWLQQAFDSKGITVHVSHTRAFKDLVPAIRESQKSGSVLIIDSITHFWDDLMTSYISKKPRGRQFLTFPDWKVLKEEWRNFTDEYVNSKVNIILCGRAGFEYDHFVDGDGQKQIEKSGIKMKAEGETGYEASLLILMARHQLLKKGKMDGQFRTATILKDRSSLIDGKVFKNPTFKDFLPHVQCLNLCGEHLGVDTQRNSKDLFNNEGKSDFVFTAEQKQIVLDEIKDVIVKHYPGSTAEEKAKKGALLDKHLMSRTMSLIETMPYHILKRARDDLWLELEGKPYGWTQAAEDIANEDIPQ